MLPASADKKQRSNFESRLWYAFFTCPDFDDLISKHVELSFFVPLIMGHGGNTGSQATCAVIRALALKQVSFRNVLGVVAKESAAGCFMGEPVVS
jgi:Mg/Co/Ni transporter MgtE